MPKDNMSPEDMALFRSLTQTVKPLKKNKHIERESPKTNPRVLAANAIFTEPKIEPINKARAEPRVSTELSGIYLSNFYTNEVGAETTLSWCRHGIPRKRSSELKQGKIAWEAKLDLHGFRADDAAQTLLDFIARHQALEHRCLLIVHGKGNRGNEAPVLKNLVNYWLQQIPQVLAFHSAIPRDGGNGALYVLLKRNREK